MNQSSLPLGFERDQRGASLLGNIFYLLILVFVIGLVIKLSPSVSEYYSIKQAVTKLAAAPSAEKARLAFEQAATVDNISSVKGRDLEISNDGGTLEIRFSYRKEVKLIGPISVVIDYSGSSK